MSINSKKIILGIYDNHDAGAALIVNGKVIEIAEEERFSRVKMECGFPKLSIDYLKEKYSEYMINLDAVALAGTHLAFKEIVTNRYSKFSIHDFLKEEERYWIPLFSGEEVDYFKAMNEYVDYSVTPYPAHTIKDPYDNDSIKTMRRQYASEILSVPIDKIDFVDHHTCHAYYAYYASPIRDDALVITVDGWGDTSNATIHVVEDGNLPKCLYRTDKCHIGRMYRFITLLLGMHPCQHEYKVMGLAAYAKEHNIKESLKVFEKICIVEGLEFKVPKRIDNLYQHLRKNLEGYRFDSIAGALQRNTENLLLQWIDNWISHTGIHKIVFSGGVSLNIKATKRIAELPIVEDFFVCLAGSDNSLPVGAAQFSWCQTEDKNELKPITHPYLCGDFDKQDIDKALGRPIVSENFQIINDPTPEDIAQILADGHIVGIMMGRMEFGPRALGHRSILADPRDTKIVQVINETIKNRDFWMPFTPSILEERAQDYLVNPKNLRSPYMTMAFDSTNLAKQELAAAVHPYDQTLRPQLVSKAYSPEYHAIISAFENLTQVGALLNTSFNIHGKPIVYKPIDVVDEIISHELVDLKYIVLNNVLLKAKDQVS
jgi:carbamoyltransferase